MTAENEQKLDQPDFGKIDDVRDYLAARINPAAVASLDAKMGLAWPATGSAQGHASAGTFESVLIFELKRGELIWLAEGASAQATFRFRDAQDVVHLLSDSGAAYTDFMARFMAAELSSDGYLPWAFTLLSLFRGGTSLRTPD